PYFILFQRTYKRTFWQKEAMNISQPSLDLFTIDKSESCKNLPNEIINVFANMYLNTLTTKNSYAMYTDAVKSNQAIMTAIES
ncbi:cardiolipin synthase, partial [Francisella tularensis subsp. holarctica]|nr:cardiolipin synthase [Francisella tularensis subsp. holarctica]